jgi:tetrahydromethanopterin S-methyltransferase subunit A
MALADCAKNSCRSNMTITLQRKSVAICTLSSIDLLEKISASEMMSKIVIVGRLLSENRGTEAMLSFTLKPPDLWCLIVSG